MHQAKVAFVPAGLVDIDVVSPFHLSLGTQPFLESCRRSVGCYVVHVH